MKQPEAKQPNALVLAEIMDSKALGKKNDIGDYWADGWCSEAADELRRLHEENQAFLNVLSWIADQTYDPWTNGAEAGRVAKFAVDKATKE